MIARKPHRLLIKCMEITVSGLRTRSTFPFLLLKMAAYRNLMCNSVGKLLYCSNFKYRCLLNSQILRCSTHLFQYRSFFLISSDNRNKEVICSSKSIIKGQFYQSKRFDSSLYFGDTVPVKWTQNTLINIHDTIGCPWWATIALTVISLRLLTTFPLSIYQCYILAKYENLTPEIFKISQELKKETALAIKMFKLNEKSAKSLFRQSLKKQITKLIVRDNCHPFKGTLSMLFQIPVWICISTSLRNTTVAYPPESESVQLACEQLAVEGTLWFTNLNMIDPTFVIPALFGLINLSIIEMNVLRNVGPKSKLKIWVTNGMRCFCVILVPIAIAMPSCVSFYWLISSVFGLGQNIVILYPGFRRFFGIPQTPSESETPILNIKNNFLEKLKKFRNKV